MKLPFFGDGNMGFAKQYSEGKGVAPLWLKLAYAAFLAVLIPVYWVHYGPENFLWFSDIALFAGFVALWREESWLPSMMAVAVLLPELAWNVSFFFRLFTGIPILDLTNYMFDSDLPLYLRALSLFHVVIPPVLLWLLYRLGYDSRGFWFATIMAWIVLPLSYFLTEPSDNINWVYGFGDEPQDRFGPLSYLGILMLFFPIAIFLPTHLVLRKLFREPHPKQKHQ